MSFTLEDDAGSRLIDAEQLAELTDLAAHLYARLHLAPAVELSLSLADEETMERLHVEWMGLSGATDVMSFPLDELRPGTPGRPVASGVLGDIVVCPQVAARQAERAGHSLADELALLTVHGFLHLLGHDHSEPGERREMFALQTQLLEEHLGRPAPVPTEE